MHGFARDTCNGLVEAQVCLLRDPFDISVNNYYPFLYLSSFYTFAALSKIIHIKIRIRVHK